MNVLTVAILQTLAAVVWFFLALKARNAFSIALTVVFALLAVSTWFGIIKAMRK